MIKIDGETYLTAKDVCARLNVSKKTLFKWEKMGLIPPVYRDWRNWRLYTDRDVQQIIKVMESKRLTRSDGEN